MKIYSTIFFCCAFFMLSAQNIIKDADCNTNPLSHEFGQRGVNQAKLSQHIEDLTWNRCLKFELTSYYNDKGKNFVNTDVRIGGDDKVNGFVCKPDTTYKFSFELKGTAQRCMVNFYEWTDPKNNFKGFSKKRTSIHLINVQKDWTKYQGTFKTSANAKRAGLCIQFWGYDNTEKLGQYILIDKISIEEEVPNIVNVAVKTEKTFSISDISSAKVFVVGNSAQTAAETADFRDLKEDKKARFETSAKIWRSGDNIVFDLNMQGAKPEVNQKNSIWLNDAAEIYFAPVKNDRRLTQFVVSADGRMWASDGSKEIKTDKWTAKTVLNDKGWRANISIPFVLLGYETSPKEGDFIAFNICRQHVAEGNYNSKPDFGKGNRWAWGRMIDHSSWSFGYGEKDKFGTMFFGSFKPYLQKQLDNIKSPELAEIKKSVSSDPSLAFAQLKYLAEQERLLKLGKEKFVVAQIKTDTDTALPFLPVELNNPQAKFKVRAAINEHAPMVLALGNMSNDFEEYRITLTRGWERNEPQLEYWYLQNGLKSDDGTLFPVNQISVRRGVQSRDSEVEKSGRRYDILSSLNEVSSVPVPAKHGGLIWITFDCRNVKPGIYKGFLNVTPLAQNRYISMKHRKDGLAVSDTSTKRIPVELEVMPFELSDEALPLHGFRGGVRQYHFDFMKHYNVCMHMVTPWYFFVKFNKDGSIAKENLRSFLEPHIKLIVKNIKDMPVSQKKVLVAYGTYANFKKVHWNKNEIAFDSPAYWNAWRNWCKVMDDVIVRNGIPRKDYSIEIADEPQIRELPPAELSRAAAELKKAVPGVHITITNASNTYAKEMAENVDSWIFSQYEIYDKKRSVNVDYFCKQPGKDWSVYCCETQLRLDLYRYYRIHAWKALDIGAQFLSIYEFYNQQPGIDFIRVLTGGLVYDTANALVPSVRLENLRIGIDDVRYMKLLEKLAATDSKTAIEARKFIKTAAREVVHIYPHDSSIACKMREKAVEFILALKKAQ